VRTDDLDLADRFFAAIQAGDLERVSDMYRDDAVVWHNYDQAEQTKEDNLKVLGWLVDHTSGLRYEEVRRQATSDGFLQQHVLRTEYRGSPLEVPACIVATVTEGRVARIDEYLDSSQIAALLR
jgi:uncharacterized protein